MNFDLPVFTNEATRNFSFTAPGGLTLEPNYIQAGVILFLLFLLILTLGQFRKRLLDWHMKGFIPGIIFGFILAMIIEGFLIVGGRTALTELVGWKNPPKPIAGALDAGRQKLIEALGIVTEKSR